MRFFDSVYTVAAVGIATFISTNADDFFILLALFSSKKFGIKNVIAGQFLGILTLIFIGSLSFFLKAVVNLKVIGALGIVPVFIGLKEYFEAIFKKKITDAPAFNYNNGYAKTFSVFIITFANGSDNLAVYIPLFASLDALSLIITAFVYMILTALLLLISYKLMNNKKFGDKIKNGGRFIFPMVLIILGVFIILKTGAYELFILK